MDIGYRRWQDWLNVILGVWLFLSPWILGFSGAGNAAWNAWIIGVAIVVFAAIAVSTPRQWEEIVNLLLGIWMVISPWVLACAGTRAAEANAIIVGLLVILFAGWAMTSMRRGVPLENRVA